MNHDNDDACIGLLMSEFDAVENVKRAAGISAKSDQADTGRAFVRAAFEWLFSQSTCLEMTRELFDALRTALRVWVNAPSPAEQLAKLEAVMMREFAYSGAEMDRLKRMLQKGERIVEILPRSVMTDRRELKRCDLPGPMPPGQYSEEGWARYLRMNYPSEATLRQVEENYVATVRMREQVARNAVRYAEQSRVAQEQLEASRVCQQQAAEDALALIVERSQARRGIAPAAAPNKRAGK